jgi:hypothetical protein
MFSGIGFAKDTQDSDKSEAVLEGVSPGVHMSVLVSKTDTEIKGTVDRYSLQNKMQTAETQSEKQDIIDSFLQAEVEESQSESTSTTSESPSEEASGVVRVQESAENADYAEDLAQKHNVGVSKSKLDKIRANAQTMSGGEVSEVAKSLAGPPESVENGPPRWANNDQGSEDKGENKEDSRESDEKAAGENTEDPEEVKEK